ncbi:MBL fold metallo-hydrolase [Pseudoalteromonas ruthenica]|uniref:MBL fold metallo-hydrolase n=1 Tax=Pseudoalteromonas ruthenica TaxID=151081 RepID=UPI001C550FEE|nr:MBL fold metallo-hydrolase [Pseudoalteromonas ruthenica]
MNNKSFMYKALMCLLWVVSFASSAQSYVIEQVKDNVYRFSAGHYHSVFMITDKGAFVTDPINADAAKWLKKAIHSRFGVAIKFMAYSHNHIDHTLGGEFLVDEQTTVVAHRYADEDMRWTKAPVRFADVTFTDSFTAELGQSSVQLSYFGPNNGRGNVSMHFMPANVMFVVDWVVLGRMPYKDLQGYDIHGMIRSTEQLLASHDFDILVGGHAQMGDKGDVRRYLAYLKTLYNSVRDALLAGHTLTKMQQQLHFPEFSHLPMYQQWRAQNIAGVYRTLIEESYFNFRPDVSVKENEH